MATKFNVIINPFTHKMCVSARVNGLDSEIVLEYDELPLWEMIVLNDSTFEVIMEYDQELELRVSDVRGSLPVKITITTKDEF
jgi:hypothetical protein